MLNYKVKWYVVNVNIDFFSSIDYNDVNHLSKQEFDEKLDTLKRKQNELNHYFFRDGCFPNNNDKNQYQSINNCTRDLAVSLKKESNDIDDDNNRTPLSWRNEINEQDNDKKSYNKLVRINSAKSNTFSMRSDFSCRNQKYDNDDLFVDIPNIPKKIRSKSSSPIRSTPLLTVPKPFKMSRRYILILLIKC